MVILRTFDKKDWSKRQKWAIMYKIECLFEGEVRMHKVMTWLLLLVMILTPMGAFAETTYTMAGFDGDGVNHDWTTNLFFQRMEERTGISFTFAQYSDYNEWLKAKELFASGQTEMPDVLFKADLTPQETMEWLEAGKIIDLKPYLAEYAPNLSALFAEHPEWEKAVTLPNGAIAALPGINELQNGNAMWINKTWLDNLGMDMPATAEELTEVLRAFKTGDPNRNGKKDEIPLTFLSMWDLKFLGHAFGIVANDYNVALGEDGVVRTPLNTEENRAFLTWLHELWQEELIDHSGFSSSDTVRKITDSNADIPYGLIMGPTPLMLLPATALSQYVMLMPLTYDGKQVYRDLTGDVIRGTFAVSSSCDDPAALVAWVDYLYSEEGCRLAQAGAEDVEYSWNEDGTWSWVADTETVASTVLAESTIAEGGNMPGIASTAFQQAYDQQETRDAIASLLALKEFAVMPYPLAYLSKEDAQRLNELQADVGQYAEQTMVWFVTGDLPINDETWEDFCNTIEEKGMSDVISILQNAVK